VKGNWNLNNVGKTNEVTHPVVGVPADYNQCKKEEEEIKIRKVDRTAFLNEIKDGHSLCQCGKIVKIEVLQCFQKE